MFCRRALSVPVGRPRSIIVGGIIYLFAVPIMQLLASREGVLQGNRFVGDPIGQVHGARLSDGTDVVIKIRRPGAYAQVTVDLDIMIRLARRLERTAEWARSLGAVRLARGFAESLAAELDYRRGAENAAAVAASLVGSETINVPTVHAEPSGPSGADHGPGRGPSARTSRCGTHSFAKRATCQDG